MDIMNFIRLMRPKQWFKSFYILIGAIPAILLMPQHSLISTLILFVGILDMILIQGVMYTVNDIYDLKKDKKHPTKKFRPIASGKISVNQAKLFALFLFIFATIISVFIDYRLLIINVILIINNFFYSVKPIRLKSKPNLDFLFAALNFPLRVVVGWYLLEPYNKARFNINLVSSKIILPLEDIQTMLFNIPQRIYNIKITFSTVTLTFISIFLFTYFLACFLLIAKRLGERISFGKKAKFYRESQEFYSTNQLETYMKIFAFLSIIMFSVFLWSLKFIFLVVLPLFVIQLYTYYNMTHEKYNIAKEPEKLFAKKKSFIFISLVMLLIIYLLLFV